MKKEILIIVCALFFGLNLKAQQVKKSTIGDVLLKNATIVTVTNGTIEGDLLIKDGMIADIGSGLSANGATEIDCSNKFVYPGFIDGGTQLGLVEISSVSLTRDSDELGDYTPHMQALTAVNPNSVSIPVTRVNGVTTVFTKPTGDLFPGTGAVIDLHGYTPDQMYAGSKAVLMNYPSTGKRGRWDRRSEDDIKKDNEKAMKKLKDFWDQAEIYAKINQTGGDYNPQLAAMVPVVNGESPLMIEVNKKGDILNALEWVNKKGIKVIFTGVSEGWRVADSLAKYDIPVITGPVLKVPSRGSDKYDACYTNPGKMHKAGVQVAIRTNETENVRNLPFNAGFAAAYGMGVEEALKAVTIVPAEIFGIADKYGSLEKGKVANLFVCDGDPFETKTQIQYLFIRGWNVPMESRHTLLYDEFLERDPGLKD